MVFPHPSHHPGYLLRTREATAACGLAEWSPKLCLPVLFPGTTWFLNIIWLHLSWGLRPWSKVMGIWLHMNKETKFSWKSWHDILLKTHTQTQVTKGPLIVSQMVMGVSHHVMVPFQCQLTSSSTDLSKDQGMTLVHSESSKFLLSRSFPFQWWKGQFWISCITGRGFILFHFPVPGICEPSHSQWDSSQPLAFPRPDAAPSLSPVARSIVQIFIKTKCVPKTLLWWKQRYGQIVFLLISVWFSNS